MRKHDVLDENMQRISRLQAALSCCSQFVQQQLEEGAGREDRHALTRTVHTTYTAANASYVSSIQ